MTSAETLPRTAVPVVAKAGDFERLSNEELLERLATLDENVFETNRFWVASLPYGLQCQGAYTPYGIGSVDARVRERWSTAALRAGSAEYALGVFQGDFDTVWQQLWNDPEFVALEKTCEVRSPRVEGGVVVSKRIPLSPEVIAHVPDELKLATRQALAGWGRDADENKGKPVVSRVRRLLDRALEALHKRQHALSFDGAGIDYENWSSDDRFGAAEDRLLDEIDRARAEKRR